MVGTNVGVTEQGGSVLSVSLIMPTYNEGGNIADLMRAAVQQVRNFGVDAVEIIVVDDDSPDFTWRIAAETSVEGVEVRVLRRLENHGLTASLNDGIAAARHQVIVWFDCDFSQPPECIPQLLAKIAAGYDVAVNSRYLPGGGEKRSGKNSAVQLFLSRCLNHFLRYLLDPRITDYTSGFIAARREVFQEIRLTGDYGEYFIDLIFRILRSGRFRVIELPYVMVPRRSGESKTGTMLIHYWRRGRKYLATVRQLRSLPKGDG